MNKSRTDLDRLFEKGISDVERTPRKTLSEAEIAAAAAASKSGAGVFLRSHTKEILLCTISFAAGCLVMIAVLHSSTPKSSEPQRNARVTELQEVGVDNDTDLDLDIDNDLGNQGQGAPTSKIASHTSQVNNPTSRVQPPTSQITNPTSHVKPPTSYVTRHTSNDTTSTSPEPVVVKKTIVKRDTVVINETVIIKDTTYVP